MLTRDTREELRGEINRRRRAQLAAERRAQRPTAVGRAVEFLEDQLSRGPRSSADVKAAASADGISATALRSGREALGVQCSNGGRTGSCWALPGGSR